MERPSLKPGKDTSSGRLQSLNIERVGATGYRLAKVLEKQSEADQTAQKLQSYGLSIRDVGGEQGRKVIRDATLSQK